MDGIIKFFTEGGLGKIMEIALGLSAVITLITGMTKSTTDDTWAAKIKDWITKIFSLVTHKDQPGTWKLPGQTASPNKIKV
jgi:hypothetical protein